MTEKQAAEEFGCAIGARSLGGGESTRELSQDSRSRLRLAERLMALDLGGERVMDATLRRQLAQAWEARRHHSAEAAQVKRWPLRRPFPALGLGIALVVALVLIVPASRAVLARPVAQLLEAVGVGPHTQVVRSEPPTSAEVATTLAQVSADVANGQFWNVHTRYGGFGGKVPPGQSPSIRTATSLVELRSLTPLTLQVPTSRHRGQAVEFSHADVAPGGPVMLYFGSGANELLLFEAPVDQGQSMSYERTVSRKGPDGKLVFETPKLLTENLILDGRAAVWDPDNTGGRPDTSALRWETDGISYSLMGRALTRDEAEALFLSLRSVDR